MPAYEVLHAIHLSDDQKEALAKAITKLHSEKFTTPKIFVNVGFTDISTACIFVAGKRGSHGGHIRGFTRAGPSRTEQDWQDMCFALDKTWHDIVGSGPETALRTVSITAGLTCVLETGLLMPLAGEDVPWLKQNWQIFEERAANGETEFADMMEDVKERGLVSDLPN